MPSFSSIFVTCLLIAFARTAPHSKRDNDNPSIVQGLLGTDGFWNDFDGGTNAYKTYLGDGSLSAGWPAISYWVSYNEMWTTNAHIMARSCDLHYQQPNNSPEETTYLYDAIKTVAHETRVDHRFILAVVLQETKGCVRAATGKGVDGEANVGILQSYKGSNTCNGGGGKVDVPCSRETILGMVRDGIAGTADGHGFAEDINEQAKEVGNDVAWAYYRAARLYDSGSIDASGDLEKGDAAHCYASDIANRLMGWTDAQSTCDLDK